MLHVLSALEWRSGDLSAEMAGHCTVQLIGPPEIIRSRFARAARFIETEASTRTFREEQAPAMTKLSPIVLCVGYESLSEVLFTIANHCV
ncbi:hypothetical protein Bpfe_027211, partial [Biomphalaria pfeifferi]